jgi:periplasmic mercuric ion binding protein
MFKIISLAAAFVAISSIAVAQSKTETFKVSGNCGMCKNKIEKAAKEAGAKTASWDEDTKVITVTYKAGSTNTAKIQQKIAAVGYDNAGAKATTESYDKLHGCCKYDRLAGNDAGCCSEGAVCKEGHESTHAAKVDCCKDGKCTKEGAASDCCKDGKCTKGESGASCCKKSQ